MKKSIAIAGKYSLNVKGTATVGFNSIDQMQEFKDALSSLIDTAKKVRTHEELAYMAHLSHTRKGDCPNDVFSCHECPASEWCQGFAASAYRAVSEYLDRYLKSWGFEPNRFRVEVEKGYSTIIDSSADEEIFRVSPCDDSQARGIKNLCQIMNDLATENQRTEAD